MADGKGAFGIGLVDAIFDGENDKCAVGDDLLAHAALRSRVTDPR